MNRVKEHCADSRDECPVIRFIEDVLQVKLLPYQKLLVTHAFETNECKRINLCSDCRTKMEKKMEETINRQAAIDAVNRLSLGETDATRLAMRIRDYLERLPSAPPKMGKWERHYSRPNVYADLFWHCSECGYRSSDNWADKFNFCPHCGAMMEK